MSILWWLISLGIAAAIIYYVFSARGEVRDVETGEPVHAGVDEEYDEEFSAGLRTGEVNEEMDAIVSGLADDDLATEDLASIDTAGAMAMSRGLRDRDEEFDSELPPDAELYEDDDDDLEADEDMLEAKRIKNEHLEEETYMDADQVKRETRSDKKHNHHHKNKRRKH